MLIYLRFFFFEVSAVHIRYATDTVYNSGRFEKEGTVQVQSEIAAIPHVLSMCTSVDVLYG